MRQRNVELDIGKGYYINYKKCNPDVIVGNLYKKSSSGTYAYTDAGKLFAYFYEFDESEVEPMFDNHWVVYIEVYDKSCSVEEMADLVIQELRDNAFVKEPYFVEIKLTDNDSKVIKQEGRTAAKDSMSQYDY